MSLSHYVTLGRSGLKVSPFCLGAMTFGEEWGFGADAKGSVEVLEHYLHGGGNFIDTANLYNKGHSERILGDYFDSRPGLRHRVVIATKFSASMYPKDPNAGGASRKSIVAACEESLRRLKTDHIDLYWQHWDDPFTPFDETMRALDDLVRDGKLRYLGVSDTPAWRVSAAQVTAQFRGWSAFVALQIEYSLLERTVEGDLIPMAQAMGLGVTPWGPLRSGVLSGKYSRDNMTAVSKGRAIAVARNVNERTFAVLEVLKAVAARRNTTAARVALAWVRQRPGVTSPILGARTREQLEDNLAALQLVLDAADVAELDAVSAPTLDFPHEFLKAATSQTYAGLTVNGRTFGAAPR
jgi:aryl-alcohol dehydrogenase-like predicted oxidoreductase